jgi:hypothetical protein
VLEVDWVSLLGSSFALRYGVVGVSENQVQVGYPVLVEEWTSDVPVKFPHLAVRIEYAVAKHGHRGFPKIRAFHVSVKIRDQNCPDVFWVTGPDLMPTAEIRSESGTEFVNSVVQSVTWIPIFPASVKPN